jgi:hypothetical protein
MPRFDATESGLRLLGAALRSNAVVPPRSRRPGRIVATAFGPIAKNETDRRGLYLYVVSIAEATIDALALELTQRSLCDIDEVVRRLILEKEIAGSASWEARRRSFRRHHGVDLRRCDAYYEVHAATDVRNAIAHGLGRLTARQIASQETYKNLARISIDVVDGQVRLHPRHVAEVVGYCRRFVHDVDARVQV